MAHRDGDGPAKTPETRTKLARFRHPQADGRVHYGDESWPIVGGVVECPLEIGEGAQWPRVTDKQIKKNAPKDDK